MQNCMKIYTFIEMALPNKIIEQMPKAGRTRAFVSIYLGFYYLIL